MSRIVKTVAIVNTHGEIVNIFYPGVLPDEGPEESDSSLTVIHITEDVNHGEYMDTKYWKDGAWKTREKKSGAYYTWADEKWTLDVDSLMLSIREARNRKLFASDWTQIPDNKLGMTKQGEWATYRQALRDVPANSSSATDLEEVSWPTEPS